MRVIVKGNEVRDTLPVVLTFLVMASAFTIGVYRDFRDNGFKLGGILPLSHIEATEKRLEMSKIAAENVRQRSVKTIEANFISLARINGWV